MPSVAPKHRPHHSPTSPPFFPFQKTGGGSKALKKSDKMQRLIDNAIDNYNRGKILPYVDDDFL